MIRELAKWALYAFIGLVANFIYPAPHVPKQYMPVLWVALACIIVVRMAMHHRPRLGYTHHADPWIDKDGVAGSREIVGEIHVCCCFGAMDVPERMFHSPLPPSVMGLQYQYVQEQVDRYNSCLSGSWRHISGYGLA